MTLAPPFVKVSQDGAVLRLTLARPDQRNPLSIGMLGALSMELGAAVEDASVHVIVIAAEGPVFSAGHDLKELTSARAAADGGDAFFRQTFTICETLMLAIANSPKPIIAEVQGLATAAGCQLVAACDIAIASSAAGFATPGVNIGLFCSTPAVPLVRAVGPKVARLMLLTGEPISAQKAMEAGLISEVVTPAELTVRVQTLAKTIALKPPATIAFGKSVLAAQETLPLAEAYRAATEGMVFNLGFPEARRGIAEILNRKSHKPL